jgi:hypothetical protein
MARWPLNLRAVRNERRMPLAALAVRKRMGAMTDDGQLIQGALYQLDGECPNHCYHAMFVLKGDYLVDTYWGTASEQYNRGFKVHHELHRLRFIIDLNRTRNASSRDEYEIYPDDKKVWIPIGGGSERYLILVDAEPCLKRQREQLERKIEECRADIRFAENRLIWHQKELAELPSLPVGEHATTEVRR